MKNLMIMRNIYTPKLFALLILVFGIQLVTSAQYTLKDSDVTIENGVLTGLTEQAKELLTYGELIIPEILQGQTVISIVDKHWTYVPGVKTEGIFGDLRIKSVIFPSNLEHIGEDAFYADGIDILDLTNCTNLTTINDWAFAGGPNGRIINLSGLSQLSYIGKKAFSGTVECEKLNLTGCVSLAKINEYAFSSHILTELDFRGLTGLKTIAKGAFYTRINNMETINFEGCSSLSIIGEEAFYAINNSYIERITGLSSCKSLIFIGNRAFSSSDNHLSSLNLPTPQLNGVTFDGWYNSSGVKVSNTVTDFETSYIALFQENVISLDGHLVNTARDAAETPAKSASLKSTNTTIENQIKFTIRNHSVNNINITDIQTTNGATLSWSSGSITTGGEQEILITYPVKDYENVITIKGDNLQGNTSISISKIGDVNTGEELVATGINNLNKESSIAIYPNPVKNGMLNILSNTPINQASILNLAGYVVYRTTDISNGINISSLPNGIYFLRISDITHKFIKE